MTGLNTKTTTTHEKLDTLIELMGQVVELLGGTPPEETVTLADVVAELVAIKEILSDVHLDTISMDQKLLAIRNYIVNPAEEPLEDDYTSLLYNVMWLRRAIAAPTFAASLDYPVQTELRDFRINEDILISTTNQILSEVIQGTLVAAFTNLGLSNSAPSFVYYGWLSQVLNWLAKISGSEGLPNDGGNRNIIELLAKIADRPESPIGSGLLPPDICAEPYVSTGMVLIPGIEEFNWPALVYAIFGDTPPSDIEYGSVFGIGVDKTELHNTTDSWDGYKIYVASSAANFGMYIGADVDASLARYPTNVWYSIYTYPYNLSVFVPGDASIKVYLCGGFWGGGNSSGGPWGGGVTPPPDSGTCYDIDSVPAEYFYNPGFTLDMQVIQFSSIPGISCTTEHTFTESTEGFDVSCTVALGNFVGWTIELLEGVAPLTVAMVSPSGSRTTDTISSIIYTIPFNTASIILCNASQGGSAASNPFTARLCSPVTP